MAEAVSTVVGSIEKILRYIAPGFVGIALLLITIPKDPTDPSSNWARQDLLLGAGVLLGVILNSCHTALLEEILCFPIVCIFRCRAVGSSELRGASTREMMDNLDARRELRRSSPDERARQFQERHDHLGATLTFLYCASYPGLMIGAWQYFTMSDPPPNPWVALGIGSMLFFFGVACDRVYTRRDIWGADKFGRAALYFS